MTSNKIFWNVGMIPFIWSQLDAPEAEGVPSRLPFKLCIDTVTGVLRQLSDPLVVDALNIAYKKGSVLAGVVDETPASKPYVDDTIEFLTESSSNKSLAGLSVLEIGSGTGYLLSVMKKHGAHVLGVEPGEHGLASGEKFQVEVINDFFPSEQIKGKFDLIILALVLEHFENPQSILSLIHPFLKKDGKLVITVPNEGPFLKAGDISSLFHEHYSYFTKQSLSNTLNKGGFEVQRIKTGERSGLLMAESYTSKDARVLDENISICLQETSQFKQLALSNLEKIKKFLDQNTSLEKSLGIYVSARILNFLSLLEFDSSKIRFFDDNPKLHRKYFPGFSQPIENKQDLLSDPPDIILIFSKNFEKKIKNSLEAENLPGTSIVTWSDLFEEM
jgi:2-polyprenyl-3-methyl-5-hydroxy-6-metoxy-1,4-benzoquinol methylase